MMTNSDIINNYKDFSNQIRHIFGRRGGGGGGGGGGGTLEHTHMKQKKESPNMPLTRISFMTRWFS